MKFHKTYIVFIVALTVAISWDWFTKETVPGIDLIVLAVAWITLYSQVYVSRKAVVQEKVLLLLDKPNPEIKNTELSKYQIILDAVQDSVIANPIHPNEIIDIKYSLKNGKPLQLVETSELETGFHSIKETCSWLRTYYSEDFKLASSTIKAQCTKVNKFLLDSEAQPKTFFCTHDILLECTVGLNSDVKVSLEKAIFNELKYALSSDS